MSLNAVDACRKLEIPLLALTRPAWTQMQGDNWNCVQDLKSAAQSLNQPARRVMLAIGRQHLPLFTASPSTPICCGWLTPRKPRLISLNIF